MGAATQFFLYISNLQNQNHPKLLNYCISSIEKAISCGKERCDTLILSTAVMSVWHSPMLTCTPLPRFFNIGLRFWCSALQAKISLVAGAVVLFLSDSMMSNTLLCLLGAGSSVRARMSITGRTVNLLLWAALFTPKILVGLSTSSTWSSSILESTSTQGESSSSLEVLKSSK